MTPLATVGLIIVSMAIVALAETAIPLHPRGRWSAAHVGPNLALTLLTFATNLCFNAALVGMLAWQNGIGLLHVIALPWAIEVAVTVMVLDLAFYVAHRAMHRYRALWRCHRVHHSDPMVDVTTTIRQH